MKVKDILKDGSVWLPNQKYDEFEPMVTVLLPTFRRAKSGHFERAVQSVLNQTFNNWELIIIDDCSTDGTFDLIKYFMKLDSRVNCIRHTYNIGLPAISEYEGYMKSRGQYIAFIFDDNEWDSHYLEKTICFMEKENYKAAYGVVYSCDENGTYIPLGLPETRNTFLDIYATNFIANGGVILHREVIEHVGLYDPHVSLTRLCDWDLWKRVLRKYIFVATGIYAGNEYGVQLKDSLGNTVPMNSWISLEQMTKIRDSQLIPHNFLEYDICLVEATDTELFRNKTKSFYELYKNKQWYNENFSLNPDFSVRKRIMIYTSGFDASLTLSFIRIVGALSEKYIFRFINGGSTPLIEFAYTDAVIFVRNLADDWGYQKICRELGIPMYYYVDDNFIILNNSKREKAYNSVKQLAELTNYKYLERFEAIFLSTKNLLNFFEEQKLHENLYMLEPAINIDCVNQKQRRRPEEKDQIVIAFMGGGFRQKLFVEIVIPALLRLQKQMNVKLLCPKIAVNTIDNDTKNRLNIQEYEYTASLDLLLQEYKRQNPDILIHCGPDIENNLYKTENSLLNAVQLGAVLVVSDVLPYANSPYKGENFIVADNSEVDWYEKLLLLCENDALREQIYQQAKEYCLKRYHPDIVAQVVKNVLNNIGSVSNGKIIQRTEELYMDLFYHQNRFVPDSISITDKKVRPLHNASLCLSKLVPDKTAYRVKVNVANWSELGICFSSYGECFGEGVIYIYDGKNLIREIKFLLEDYVHDFWTYFQFDPIEDSYNKIFTIQFLFRYEKGSSMIGIFEDNTKRSFSYKVFSRLGYRKSKLDVLFADCRS